MWKCRNCGEAVYYFVNCAYCEHEQIYPVLACRCEDCLRWRRSVRELLDMAIAQQMSETGIYDLHLLPRWNRYDVVYNSPAHTFYERH